MQRERHPQIFNLQSSIFNSDLSGLPLRQSFLRPRPRTVRNPTSSSPWATTSAGQTSAPTTAASCQAWIGPDPGDRGRQPKHYRGVEEGQDHRGGKQYKVHLDGYDQTEMLTKGGESKREGIWYFTESHLAAARVGHWKYVLTIQPAFWRLYIC